MTIVHKRATSESRGMEFVLSDATVDLHGDVVEPTGWDLSSFPANPMALFNHDRNFIVGKWADVRVIGGKLLGRLEMAAAGTSPRLDELRSLVEQGILRAVSIGFKPLEIEPVNKDRPYVGKRYKRQRLLEASLVSIGANPAALLVAKSLNISDDTLTLAFGEYATKGLGGMGRGSNGENAAPTSPNRFTKMKTLSQRIEDAQADLTTKKDRLAELNGADTLDLDAIEALNEQIDYDERTVKALKTSESRIGVNARPAGGGDIVNPATLRRPLGYPQKDIEPVDLLVRAMTVQGIAHFGKKSIDRVLDERYPGHEATAIVAKADQTIGTTTVSGWASELVQTVNQGFLQALTGVSIYPRLRDRGVGLSFDGVGTIKLPRRTAGGAGGGFVAEGSPIRVGRITTAAAELTPKKMGVIVPFSRELAKRSTPAIESIVRQAILEDTAAVLDAALLDATAASTARPAGLLNGVAATATGYGGGDHVAVKEDFKALLAPFITANAADNITVIMNPAQGLSIAMMDGPDNNSGWFSGISGRVNIVESTYATAGRLIAIRNSDFYTAIGDAPDFDISEQATIHMEDTTPLEIVSGTGPTTADPVRSLWQTGTIGVRMLTDISWVMGRPSMVAWINGTSY